MTLGENYREYRSDDKSDWGPGPWQDEPDKAQWIDPATQLDCLIVRNHHGALCGYVGVPAAHPLYGASYDTPAVEVHGGLTFADRCDPSHNEARAICHVPAPGRPDDVYWFGFDTAHAFDLAPGIESALRRLRSKEVQGLRDLTFRDEFADVYRDWAYVVGEVTSLARQLYDILPAGAEKR